MREIEEVFNSTADRAYPGRVRSHIRGGAARTVADDPLAALDRELAWLAARLRMARNRGEQAAAAWLAEAIDLHLDERHRISAQAPRPYRH